MARLTAEGARLPVGYEANGGFLLGGTAVSPGRPAAGAAADARRHAPDRWRSSPPWRARGGRSRSSWPTCPRARRPAAGWRRSMSRPAARLLAGAGGRRRGPRRAPRSARGRALTATDTLDGVRMTLASGEIVHLRLSGNAPELRCYVEAATPSARGALLASVLGEVERLLRRRRRSLAQRRKRGAVAAWGAPASGSRKGSRSAGAGRSAAVAASLRRKRTSSAEVSGSPRLWAGPRVCSIGIHASMNTREGPVGR